MTGMAQNYFTAERIIRLTLSQGFRLIRTQKRFAILIVTTGLMLGCQSVSYQTQAKTQEANRSYSKAQADEIAYIRTQMAAQYLQQNQLDNAKRQLEKALSANERYAPAYDMMGVLLQTEGSPLNITKAESYFRQALVLQPQLMKARNNYGVYLAQLGRYDEALTQFEIAGAALGYEGRIKALENLGVTALKVGDYPLATDTFVRILERDRSNLLAHLELVDLLIMDQQWQQAKTLYAEMLTLVAEQGTAHPRIQQQGAKLSL